MNLTPIELSNRWSLAIGTLANWRNRKQGPKFVKLGRKVIYRLKDVEAFEKKHLMNVRRV